MRSRFFWIWTALSVASTLTVFAWAGSKATVAAQSANCEPSGGVRAPSVCIAKIDVNINDLSIETLLPSSEIVEIALDEGDTVSLENLWYCASRRRSNDSVAGEAYLFPGFQENYEFGLFTKTNPRIRGGCGRINDFPEKWIPPVGRHRVVIALVHYHGNTYEVDSRMYFALNVRP